MVAGNNMGKRLAFFESRIALVDQEAPYYDFNTFYIQMAIDSSGGTSGSPVLRENGEVVGLHCVGVKEGSYALSLPTVRIKRALEMLQNRPGQPIPRGTLLTVFQFLPADRLKGYRLMESTRKLIQQESLTGLLTVKEIVPGSPASDALEVGDVLVSVNGTPLSSHTELAEHMDEGVGDWISLVVDRLGTQQQVSLEIHDLDKLVPDEICQLETSLFCSVSYRYAQRHNVAVKGVQILRPGHNLSPKYFAGGEIVNKVDGQDISGLEDFKRILINKPEGAKVGFNYMNREGIRNTKYALVPVTRRWLPLASLVRGDRFGQWRYREHPAPAPAPAPPAPEQLPMMAEWEPDESIPHQSWLPSLVKVDISPPFILQGPLPVQNRFPKSEVIGVVVDVEKGWVLTDSQTIRTGLADIDLTFMGKATVPARLLKFHPKLNLSILQFDTRKLSLPVRPVQFADRPVHSGQQVKIVGLDQLGSIKVLSDEISVPMPETQPVFNIFIRKRSESDQMLAKLRHTLDHSVDDYFFSRHGMVGLVVNESDEPIGINFSMLSQHGFISSAQLTTFVQQVSEGVNEIWDLGVGVKRISIINAKMRGLPEEWVSQFQTAILEVFEIEQTAPAYQELKNGDLLLAINGVAVLDYLHLQKLMTGNKVKVTVFRDGDILEKEVSLVSYSFDNTDRFIFWQGGVIHKAFDALRILDDLKESSVYISNIWPGSPLTGEDSALSAGRLIVSVDGKETPDFDTFLDVIGKLKKPSITIETLSPSTKSRFVNTISPDRSYWKTQLFEKDSTQHWQRKYLDFPAEE